MKKHEIDEQITALYERLSKDDEKKSESIPNQKLYLEEYAQRNGFKNVQHFTDDRISGTNFNRPGLNALLEEIRKGRVSTVIIKDQSRIGRDVVEIGLLKRTFEEFNVRFIAADDNFDTAKGYDIMSVFRDVFNEFHVADTSRKIRTVFKSRMENGLRCSGSFPYGYLPDKNNKNEWIIDEEAAVIVRRIFNMIIDGKTVNDIGRTLRAEQIPIPSEHWKRIGVPSRSNTYTDPYAWSATTLLYLLQRPEYKGQMVLGKTKKESYKTSKHRHTAPEERHVFNGAVPAIIDEETWENVQRLRSTVRRTKKNQAPPSRLTGILYCADCNSKLTHKYGLIQNKWIDDSFICSSYKQLTRDCKMHYITTKNMESLILSAIQRISWYVRENEKDFVQKVREASSVQHEETAKDNKRRLNQSKQRFNELDMLVKNLYEANATGKLSDRHFDRLIAEYDTEQAELETVINELQSQIDTWSEDKLKTSRFIELVKRYTDFSELTTPMLNEFIEKVIVHEGDKRGKERRQRVDIHLNFIGAFAVPADVITPYEIEEERRQQKELDEKIKRSAELYQIRYENRLRQNREFTERRNAGLLTPEEAEAEEQRLEQKREYNKKYAEKRKAAQPPKPPKPLSRNAILKRKSEGLPLTPEEYTIYREWQDKKTAQTREWRNRKKAEQTA